MGGQRGSQPCVGPGNGQWPERDWTEATTLQLPRACKHRGGRASMHALARAGRGLEREQGVSACGQTRVTPEPLSPSEPLHRAPPHQAEDGAPVSLRDIDAAQVDQRQAPRVADAAHLPPHVSGGVGVELMTRNQTRLKMRPYQVGITEASLTIDCNQPSCMGDVRGDHALACDAVVV